MCSWMIKRPSRLHCVILSIVESVYRPTLLSVSWRTTLMAARLFDHTRVPSTALLLVFTTPCTVKWLGSTCSYTRLQSQTKHGHGTTSRRNTAKARTRRMVVLLLSKKSNMRRRSFSREICPARIDAISMIDCLIPLPHTQQHTHTQPHPHTQPLPHPQTHPLQ